MLRKEFVEAVVDEIRNIVGDNAEVRHNEIRKNNGLVLNGVTILLPGETISPMAYIENFVKDEYERVDYVTEIHNIAKEIIVTIAKFRNEPIMQIEKDNFTNFEYIKDKLCVLLVNYETNREMLKDLPYEIFLDLAIICCIKVGNDGMIKIPNNLLDNYGVTKETLFEIAKENTPKLEPAIGTNMVNMIFGLINGNKSDEDLDDFVLYDDAPPMYVLTNKDKHYGATTMLYNEVLDKLASQIDRDLVVIPSSIHEVILLPYDDEMDIEAVTKMVQEVNQDVVDQEEMLSNHAYIYNRTTRQIEMP